MTANTPNLYELQEIKQRYEHELLDSVMPFWVQHAPDPKFGGFFQSLDRDGSVYDTDKYMWMQWRIVYILATMVNLTQKKVFSTEVPQKITAEWLQLAKDGFAFLTTHGKDEHGMYYFTLNRAGEPIYAPSNIYSEAFAVMGSAALFAATRDPIYQMEATSAMQHYLQRIPNPKGKWCKDMPSTVSRLSLGHYMILANLGSVMKECTGTTEFDADIEKAAEMVLNRFWHPTERLLFENINTDFTFDLDSPDGRHLNPGHGLESMWFLLEYAEKQPSDKSAMLVEKIKAVILALLDKGWDHEYGGIYYFLDARNRPHKELTWDMKLWWVHNEAMVATLYAYRITRDPVFWSWFQKIESWSWAHFKDPQYPEWFGYLNRRGEPTHYLKGGKWKTCFHLPRYLWKAIEQFNRLI
jgi:N-acylglucosamine 2-epimerase